MIPSWLKDYCCMKEFNVVNKVFKMVISKALKKSYFYCQFFDGVAKFPEAILNTYLFLLVNIFWLHPTTQISLKDLSGEENCRATCTATNELICFLPNKQFISFVSNGNKGCGSKKKHLTIYTHSDAI